MLQLRSLNEQLSTLRSTFDEAILKGHSFDEVKRIYTQIKEVERSIISRQLDILKNGHEGNEN